MPTQEERLTALEQTTAEYRPVLQNIAYELTMVKGLTIDQVGITHERRERALDTYRGTTQDDPRTIKTILGRAGFMVRPFLKSVERTAFIILQPSTTHGKLMPPF